MKGMKALRAVDSSQLIPLLRYVHHAAFGVVTVLAAACHASNSSENGPEVSATAYDASWFAERDTLLTALSRREAQWAERRPPVYRFRAMWATMAYYQKADVVAAAGRPLIVCDTLGAPADSLTREIVAVDIPALFESVRTALVDTTQAVIVRFDPERGFPAYVQIGDRWMSDVGHIRTVEHFRAVSVNEAHCSRT